jgi:hypothetical protein
MMANVQKQADAAQKEPDKEHYQAATRNDTAGDAAAARSRERDRLSLHPLWVLPLANNHHRSTGTLGVLPCPAHYLLEARSGGILHRVLAPDARLVIRGFIGDNQIGLTLGTAPVVVDAHPSGHHRHGGSNTGQ